MARSSPSIRPPRIEVDLAALVRNWRLLAESAAPAECAAVIKADGYGLGAAAALRALARAGCRTFYVATANEAEALTPPEGCALYVLNGPAGVPGHARPVLNTLADLRAWDGRPAALMIDTGMNRLGLAQAEVAALGGYAPELILSHLACADTPEHPMNAIQSSQLSSILAQLPGSRGSLANSWGVALGKAFHFDMVRPGIGLYAGPNLVARVIAPVIQLREAKAGETVGYGATPLAKDTRIAIVAAGYGDGYPRDFGYGKVSATWRGEPLATLGRISMDLTALDCGTARPLPGDDVELLGAGLTLADAAAACGTLPYEVLTRLSPRLARVHSGV